MHLIARIILGWIFFMLFTDFKAQGLRRICTLPVMALTEFFLKQMFIYFCDHGILVLICYGNIYVLVCI